MQSPDPAARQIAAIEVLVERRAWSEIEAVVRSLPALLDSCPEHDRKPMLTALARYLESLEGRVERWSGQVAAELGALREGRKAARHYRACARALGDLDITPDM